MSYDLFLRINGITGDSVDKQHAGELELYSFSFGASNAAAPDGTTGKAQLSSLNVMTKHGSASLPLYRACLTGQRLKDATMTARHAGASTPSDFLRWSLTDVFVDSIQDSGSTGADDTPTESVSLRFASIQMAYVQTKKDGTAGGTIQTGWDVRSNRPLPSPPGNGAGKPPAGQPPALPPSLPPAP